MHQASRRYQSGILVAIGRVQVVVEQPEPVLILSDHHARLAPPFEIEHELPYEIRRVVSSGVGEPEPIERGRGDVLLVGVEIDEHAQLGQNLPIGLHVASWIMDAA